MSGGFPFNERRDEELWMREILFQMLGIESLFLGRSYNDRFLPEIRSLL